MYASDFTLSTVDALQCGALEHRQRSVRKQIRRTNRRKKIRLIPRLSFFRWGYFFSSKTNTIFSFLHLFFL